MKPNSVWHRGKVDLDKFRYCLPGKLLQGIQNKFKNLFHFLYQCRVTEQCFWLSCYVDLQDIGSQFSSFGCGFELSIFTFTFPYEILNPWLTVHVQARLGVKKLILFKLLVSKGSSLYHLKSFAKLNLCSVRGVGVWVFRDLI